MKLEISARHAVISGAIFAVMMWGFVESVVFTNPILVIPSVIGLGIGALFIGAIIDDVFLKKDDK